MSYSPLLPTAPPPPSPIGVAPGTPPPPCADGMSPTAKKIVGAVSAIALGVFLSVVGVSVGSPFIFTAGVITAGVGLLVLLSTGPSWPVFVHHRHVPNLYVIPPIRPYSPIESCSFVYTNPPPAPSYPPTVYGNTRAGSVGDHSVPLPFSRPVAPLYPPQPPARPPAQAIPTAPLGGTTRAGVGDHSVPLSSSRPAAPLYPQLPPAQPQLPRTTPSAPLGGTTRVGIEDHSVHLEATLGPTDRVPVRRRR